MQILSDIDFGVRRLNGKRNLRIDSRPHQRQCIFKNKKEIVNVFSTPCCRSVAHKSEKIGTTRELHCHPLKKKFYIHLNKLFITCTPCLDQPLKEKERYGNYLCTYILCLTYSLAHLIHTPPTTIFLTVFVLRTTDKVLERIPSAVQNLTIIAVCPILVVV